MVKFNKLSLGKGAAYLYVEQVVAVISGYVFWLFLTKVTSTDIIGISATVVSVSSIFATILSFGIPGSISRFLGKSFSNDLLVDAKVFVKASLLITSLGIIVGSIFILLLQDFWVLDTLGYTLTILTIVLMGSTAFANLLRYIVISSLDTKKLAWFHVISSIVKMILSFALLLLGIGAIGLTIGYISGQTIIALLIAGSTLVLFKQVKDHKSALDFRIVCKRVLEAGIPGWIPAAITTVGGQLGTVVIFGAAGTSQAGTYFISFSIFQGIAAMSFSLMSTAFPILSAKEHGRRKLTWRLIKISSIFSLFLSSSILLYPEEVLGLLGEAYIDGSLPLQILLLSVLPTIVMTGINTLVYSYGNYRDVLSIGLASSVPRTVLYFVLVPMFGGTGAAISFTIGSITGFIMSTVIAKKIGMSILWKDLFFMFIIPSAIAVLLAYFETNYIASIVVTPLFSYVLLVKLRIITRRDIQDTIGIMPVRISRPAIRALTIIGERVNHSY